MRSRLLLSGGAVTLDEALVGMIILMRWAAPHGWAVGKVTSQITTSTPRGHASSETITFAAHGPTVGPVGWTTQHVEVGPVRRRPCSGIRLVGDPYKIQILLRFKPKTNSLMAQLLVTALLVADEGWGRGGVTCGPEHRERVPTQSSLCVEIAAKLKFHEIS